MFKLRRVFVGLLILFSTVFLYGFIVPGNSDFTLFVSPSVFTTKLLGIEDFPEMLFFGKLSSGLNGLTSLLRMLKEPVAFSSFFGDVSNLAIGMVVRSDVPLEDVLSLVEKLAGRTGVLIDLSDEEKEIFFGSNSAYLMKIGAFWYACFSKDIRQLIADVRSKKAPTLTVTLPSEVTLHYKTYTGTLINQLLYYFGEHWGSPRSEELVVKEEDGVVLFELSLERTLDSYEKDVLQRYEASLSGLYYLEDAEYLFGGSGLYGALIFEILKSYADWDADLTNVMPFLLSYLISIKFDYEVGEFVWHISGKYLPENERILALLFSGKYDTFSHREIKTREKIVNATIGRIGPGFSVARYPSPHIGKLYMKESLEYEIVDVSIMREPSGVLKLTGKIHNLDRFGEILSELFPEPTEEEDYSEEDYSEETPTDEWEPEEPPIPSWEGGDDDDLVEYLIEFNKLVCKIFLEKGSVSDGDLLELGIDLRGRFGVKTMRSDELPARIMVIFVDHDYVHDLDYVGYEVESVWDDIDYELTAEYPFYLKMSYAVAGNTLIMVIRQTWPE